MTYKLLMLNTARNALRYIIQAYGIKKLHLPFYTCPAIWQAARKEGCKLEFYHIDKNFLPLKNFNRDDFIIITNYFGICSANSEKLSSDYPNIITDNAHACFASPVGIASFYSLRKFYDVTDGSILYTTKTTDKKLKVAQDYMNVIKLLKRNEFENSSTYNEFCDNESRLEKEDISIISKKTKDYFGEANQDQIKQKRLQNFYFLHKYLKETNELDINLCDKDIPMCYPYLPKNRGISPKTRKRFEQNNIYIEQYWSKMPNNSIEGDFQKYLLPLPIHQKYSHKDMQKLIEIIRN